MSTIFYKLIKFYIINIYIAEIKFGKYHILNAFFDFPVDISDGMPRKFNVVKSLAELKKNTFELTRPKACVQPTVGNPAIMAFRL